MIQNFRIAACSVLGVWGCLFALEIQGNYYADEDRELFLMPRSAALGGADAALSSSALPLGNPANLTVDSMRNIALAYAGYYQNSFSTSSLSYTGMIDNGSALGVSISYLLVPDIELHPDTNYQANVPTVNASDLFFRVSYGTVLWRLSNEIALHGGAAINGEKRNLIEYTGYGIGADAGLNLFFDLKRIASNAATGIMVENITRSYIRWSSDYAEFAYPHIRLSLGWQQYLPYLYGKYSFYYVSPDLLSNEGINSYSNSTDTGTADRIPEVKTIMENPALLFSAGREGFEYTLMNVLSFRIGLRAGSWSFGGGLHLLHDRAGIDFAYLSNDLAPTYKLSVNYRWQ